MTRVIVHAGFHKTGTTSLQDFLSHNRAALAPFLTYYGKSDFLHAGASARIYAQRPFIWRRLAFRRSFERFLAGVGDAPNIVLSRENFGGGMPGHRDCTRRMINDQTVVATVLAKEIIRAVKHRFGPHTEIEILYTTRDRADWIDSIYGHLLRSINLTQTRDSFHQSMSNLPDPQTITRSIAKAIEPVRVHTVRLEDFATTPEGPAGAILDLLDVPTDLRAGLIPAARQNVGQSPELKARFLQLNRGRAGKKALRSVKNEILRQSEQGPKE